MAEELGADHKDSEPSVRGSIDFEFSDERVLDMQSSDAMRHFGIRIAAQPSEGVESFANRMYHRHEQDRTVAIFGMSYYGPKSVISSGFILEESTYIMLNWLKEVGLDDATFSNVILKMREGILGNYTDESTENLTIEAQVFKNNLRELDSIRPEDIIY